MVRKPPRGIRGLRHIRTACGPSYPRAVSTGRRSIIPPDDSSYSMRSFTPSSFGGGQSQQSKSPFKARVVAPSPSSLLRVQKFYAPLPELLQEHDCINVRISLSPAAAEVAQFDVQGDILIVQAEVEDAQYHTECLLPFEANLISHSYDNGTLCINLKAKFARNKNQETKEMNQCAVLKEVLKE